MSVAKETAASKEEEEAEKSTKSEAAIKSAPVALQQAYAYTGRHLLRTYPAGWRVDSSNYHPVGAAVYCCVLLCVPPCVLCMYCHVLFMYCRVLRCTAMFLYVLLFIDSSNYHPVGAAVHRRVLLCAVHRSTDVLPHTAVYCCALALSALAVSVRSPFLCRFCAFCVFMCGFVCFCWPGLGFVCFCCVLALVLCVSAGRALACWR